MAKLRRTFRLTEKANELLEGAASDAGCAPSVVLEWLIRDRFGTKRMPFVTQAASIWQPEGEPQALAGPEATSSDDSNPSPLKGGSPSSTPKRKRIDWAGHLHWAQELIRKLGRPFSDWQEGATSPMTEARKNLIRKRAKAEGIDPAAVVEFWKHVHSVLWPLDPKIYENWREGTVKLEVFLRTTGKTDHWQAAKEGAYRPDAQLPRDHRPIPSSTTVNEALENLAKQGVMAIDMDGNPIREDEDAGQE